MRLDVYLVKNAFFPSRELAKFNITKGNVLVNGKVAIKPSFQVDDSDEVTLSNQNAMPYVSRGGFKLEKALQVFGVSCNGLQVVDVGASTGGFTDCALQHGAASVCAIDVGTNQLVRSLRENSRVTSIEGVNIKDLHTNILNPSQFHLLVTDLSFISLTKVMGYFKNLLLPKGSVIALIKPQFEVGASSVGKGGIVKDPQAHKMAIRSVIVSAAEHGLFAKQLSWAPIQSASKNIEYLAHFVQEPVEEPNIDEVVKLAFAQRKSVQTI